MPKCSPMLSVPFGLPRPVSTFASLMSSFASRPDRIGLDEAVVPWLEATPHVSASTEMIARARVSIGTLLPSLAISQLWIEADPQPIAQHVGGEHEHRDAHPRE